MSARLVLTLVLSCSVAFVPTSRASADAGDFVAGAVVGGIAGHLITKNQQQKKAAQQRQTYQRSTIPATQRGAEIQSSLNYFGFNAGAVDGQLGRQSRSAISSYQAYLGYPVTGQLTPFEENLLVSSHMRAQAQGPAAMQLIASNPDGTRGLLKIYRAEMAGQPTAPGTTMAVVPQVGTTTTTTVVTASPAPSTGQAPQAETTASAALPNFMGGSSQPSLASHCNTVSLLTNTNGGFTTVSTMSDPMQALNEQFCLARTYAIATSEQMISKVQGFTPAQIAEQCAGFGPVMQDSIAALSLKTEPEVIADVQNLMLSTGMSPAQMEGTAKICLGVGYRTDDLDVALGSALMLVAMGQSVYAELIGYHLSQGFGTSQRPDMARVWYAEALNALDAGAAPVFAPGQPERTELLRKASMTMAVDSSASPAQSRVQPVSGLPAFKVSE